MDRSQQDFIKRNVMWCADGVCRIPNNQMIQLDSAQTRVDDTTLKQLLFNLNNRLSKIEDKLFPPAPVAAPPPVFIQPSPPTSQTLSPQQIGEIKQTVDTKYVLADMFLNGQIAKGDFVLKLKTNDDLFRKLSSRYGPLMAPIVADQEQRMPPQMKDKLNKALSRL